MISVTVTFYSYFKELAGTDRITEYVPEGTVLGELVGAVLLRLPKLAPMRRSMLVAVGVDYQDQAYVLKDNDEVAMFPPVQGG